MLKLLRWIVLVFLTGIGHGDGQSILVNLCDNNICTTCSAGVLACQRNLLTALPEVLPDSYKRVFINKEPLRAKVLKVNTFSKWTKQLSELRITGSGLTRISSDTFSEFVQIGDLDLSSNNLELVDDDAFANVQIGTLDLSKNRGVRFSPNAFRKARIGKLILLDCEMVELPFTLLEPILSELKNLDVSSNKLTDLDERFESIKQLTVWDNPFNCGCSIRWLVSRLAHATDYNSDETYCASPSSLVNRRLASLKASDFFCDPPRIERLELDISPQSTNVGNADERTLKAAIRCVAQGSPQLKQRWEQARGDAWFPVNALHTDASGILQLMQPKTIDQASDKLRCLVNDVAGNASSELQLTWPPFPLLATAAPSTITPRTATKTSGPDPLVYGANPHLTEDNENFLIRKQFTVLEMIGAVVGTFTATIALFVLCYCVRQAHGPCWSRKSLDGRLLKNAAPYSDASGLDHSTNLTGLLSHQSPNGGLKTMGGYAQQNGYLSSSGDESNSTLNKARQAQSNPQNVLVDTSGHTATTYSDCQTYDLPNYTSSAPTPLMPLPPLPKEATLPLLGPGQAPMNPELLQQYAQYNNPQFQTALAMATMNRFQPIDFSLLQLQQQQLQLAQQTNNTAPKNNNMPQS